MAVECGRSRSLPEKPGFKWAAEQLPADPGGGVGGQDDGRQDGADALPVERRVPALGERIAAGPEYQMVEGIERRQKVGIQVKADGVHRQRAHQTGAAGEGPVRLGART